MRYLITGHTGFKGAWLSLWLTHAGHEVSGFSLNPETGSLFESAQISELMYRDIRGDVRDQFAVADALNETAPDVIVHMAAQPLVRESYRQPRLTIETNVLGTMNVLEAAAASSAVKAVLVITTDKVYKNVDQANGYLESDALGGHDPYSASKAMADILTQSWSASFPGVPTAIVRAGNVIGGGDICHERLVPDIVRAIQSGSQMQLRFPDAIRPWQHVLDCLNGYMRIIDSLLETSGPPTHAESWNIGPESTNVMSVSQLCDKFAAAWDGHPIASQIVSSNFHEAGLLLLDTAKARTLLGWKDRLTVEQAIEWTADWYRREMAGEDSRELTLKQIRRFTE